MSGALVLCEGYHDRAFWAGLLCAHGWSDPGASQRAREGRVQLDDLWGRRLGRGAFRFDRPDGVAVVVEPCGGRSKVLPTAAAYLQQRATRPVGALVISLDLDAPAGVDEPALASARQAVDGLVRGLDPTARRTDDDRWEVTGDCAVYLVVWRTPPDTPTLAGLPAPQTLERVVCGALAEAYPARQPHVTGFLAARPAPPAPDAPHKATAWAHMAGWYAERGCEDFYRAVWQDAAVAQALRRWTRALALDALLAQLAGTRRS